MKYVFAFIFLSQVLIGASAQAKPHGKLTSRKIDYRKSALDEKKKNKKIDGVVKAANPVSGSPAPATSSATQTQRLGSTAYAPSPVVDGTVMSNGPQVQTLPNSSSGSSTGMNIASAIQMASLATNFFAPNTDAAKWSRLAGQAAGAYTSSQALQSASSPLSSMRYDQIGSRVYPQRTEINPLAAVAPLLANSSAMQIPREYVREALTGLTSKHETHNLRAQLMDDGTENMGHLLLASADSLRFSGMGPGNGFSLKQIAGWARLNSDGSVSIPRGTSHCTSATHAAFLKFIGELIKRGKIQATSQLLANVNSTQFRDIWNSNGWGVARLMKHLGGISFSDPRMARKGDVVKIDRPNGGGGHMAIFSHLSSDGRVCYISSNRGTNGVGLQCESLRNSYVFSRIPNVDGLGEKLANLNTEMRTDGAFAQVRSRGGHGFVDRSYAGIISAHQVLAWAPLSGGASQTASLQEQRSVAGTE